MGLDQYGYTQQGGSKEEIAYWRKHPNLQGWMEALYREKGGTEEFNCVPLELTAADLHRLKHDIEAGALPETEGFFFGSGGDDYYKEADLKFIRQALEATEEGKQVFYDSWW